jgi:aspartate/methionine/tyrosine aminotransferase
VIDNSNLMSFFKLKPLKAAKVSEISEATSASLVDPEERVNFHIGNPIQNPQLDGLHLKLVLNLDVSLAQLADDNLKQLIHYSCWDENQAGYIKVIADALINSIPYLPRGGFNRNKPNKLALLFQDWLTIRQEESLDYDLGDKSGRREIIFASGGVWENLRIFFHSISHYLINLPVHILLMEVNLPDHLLNFPSLIFHHLPQNEQQKIQYIKNELNRTNIQSTFLIIGDLMSENLRRELRHFGLKYPLFFIEINNAPNHLSIAREAGLMNRVIRFIHPSAIHPQLSNLSISFILGNADFLKIIETIHFELKGTPAASEVELLTFLMDRYDQSDRKATDFSTENNFSLQPNYARQTDSSQYPSISQLVNRVNKSLSFKVEKINQLVEPIIKRTENLNERLQHNLKLPINSTDPFIGMSIAEIVQAFFYNFHNPQWHKRLIQAFLSRFLSHHREYSIDHSFVVSGSARTALSLLGFHCNINEIIVPDLSWTYEHCFLNIDTVALKDDFSLDVDGIIEKVKQKIVQNPHWHEQGAVLLNNPHNASGKVFGESNIVKLIIGLLERDIFIIDDLSYQNLAPTNDPASMKTIRQLANDLIKKGVISSAKIQYIITVHSLSKTDCFAGARLAVLEILHPALHQKFSNLNATIQHNLMAILIAYLFYRNSPEKVGLFWLLRNQIFNQKMIALETAYRNLSSQRNPFEIEIQRQEGSMYPRMIIHRLPPGISLDWLSSGLALQGIGLIPLTTFARTARGYELARKTFRLTLGGTDDPDTLLRKTRRVLIDLNRLIAEESLNYTRKNLPPATYSQKSSDYFSDAQPLWDETLKQLQFYCKKNLEDQMRLAVPELNAEKNKNLFFDHLNFRCDHFTQRFQNRLQLSEIILSKVNNSQFIEILEQELYKESLQDRTKNFRHRLYDRTVHPTQMYSLKVDLIVEGMIDSILNKKSIEKHRIERLAIETIKEYIGTNVPINSTAEADELVLDLKLLIETEDWARFHHQVNLPSLLSFWGDWDGSTRPSGQGHRLVAAALIQNVSHLAAILKLLIKIDNKIEIDAELLDEIQKLDISISKFWKLLNEITSLTNQLEKRYSHVLPFDLKAGKLRNIGMKLHLAHDPITSLWLHNDRLERKMLHLRGQRRKNLEYYFSLNKKLRKTLYQFLPIIQDNLHHPQIALSAGCYRSYLKRFNLTPRIHQKMILSHDQFGIDTTVHNMSEINEIAGEYGTPGIVMAIQVSMSTDPEAIIQLDRKLRSKQEEILRQNSKGVLPHVCVVPLFEDIQTIENLPSFLDRLWEYSLQSQRLSQSPGDRFSEMICELFFAGSDLSQQVSQSAGAVLYRKAKHKAVRWFAERGLIEKIRIKFGSGESMQRQGGYYDENSGKPLLVASPSVHKILANNLKESVHKSLEFASSPLRGVLAGAEFRTYQSNLAEHLRRLPTDERANLIYHVSKSQKYYENELARAAEPLQETRLQFQRKGFEELERLTLIKNDEIFNEFIELATRNYQQILYGRVEDVVGIHVISYFISRAIPTLRDRPTVRPTREIKDKQGQQIIEKLTQTLPLFKHGSLFRAIGHNQAQSVILGVNQLTTGLFRALHEFSGRQYGDIDGMSLISERILPFLPVQDILHTLRIFHDLTLSCIRDIEPVFPAGNSAFLVLREDNDSILLFINLMQKELLRRQGLDVTEFFKDDQININILPAFRPEISVLLQPDIFNTKLSHIFPKNNSGPDEKWKVQFKHLLEMPVQIQDCRKKTWQLIKKPISQQVSSFTQLALAIYSLSQKKDIPEVPFTIEPTKVQRLESQIANLLRGSMDDYMREFLKISVKYLTQIPQYMTDLPIDVFRALRDVEQILRIEEQILEKKEQNILGFYILKIARLCGENG